MTQRILALGLVATAVALASCGQSPSANAPATGAAGTAAAQGGAWKQPTTAWGDPDIQGMWPIINLISTPFQRAKNPDGTLKYGDRLYLTDEEYAKTEQALAARDKRYEDEIKSNKMGMGHWAEASHHNEAARLTSLMREPANGQFPELTERGKELASKMSSSWSGKVFEKPTDFDTWDRCITRGLPPSMFPFNYNNGIRDHPGAGLRRDPARDDPRGARSFRSTAARARPRGQAMDGRVARSLGRQHARRRDDELQRPRRHDQRRHSGLAARRHADDDQHEDHGALHAHRRRHDGVRRCTSRIPRCSRPPWTAGYPMERDSSYQFFEYACNEDNTAVRNYITTSRYERAQAANAEKKTQAAAGGKKK